MIAYILLGLLLLFAIGMLITIWWGTTRKGWDMGPMEDRQRP